ncbi:MAG TPA: DUF2007 domain-containing protein [Pirellulales bacterium]|jgi:hypothetical protein
MSINDDQVAVFADARPGLAYMVRNRLTEAGIKSYIDNEALRYGANELLPAVIPPRVFVSADDAEAARHIVAEFKIEENEPSSEPSNAEIGKCPTIVADSRQGMSINHHDCEDQVRPSCPQCGHGRMTVCPYCETASADFSTADEPPAASGERAGRLLLCHTCDEPFEPTYYRRCEWCGHDFGSGKELATKTVVEYLNDRVIVAMMGLTIAVLVILVYFGTIVK